MTPSSSDDADWPLPAVLRNPTEHLRVLQRRLAAHQARMEAAGTATWLAEAPPNRPPFEEVPFPVDGSSMGQPVPALELLPPTRWLRALASTGQEARQLPAARLPDLESAELALLAEAELMVAGAHGRWRPAVPEAAVPDIGSAFTPRRRGTGKQVNVRMTPDEHAIVQQAAARLGMAPTSLVRAFALEGAQQVLARAARAASGARGR